MNCTYNIFFSLIAYI